MVTGVVDEVAQHGRFDLLGSSLGNQGFWVARQRGRTYQQQEHVRRALSSLDAMAQSTGDYVDVMMRTMLKQHAKLLDLDAIASSGTGPPAPSVPVAQRKKGRGLF